MLVSWRDDARARATQTKHTRAHGQHFGIMRNARTLQMYFMLQTCAPLPTHHHGDRTTQNFHHVHMFCLAEASPICAGRQRPASNPATPAGNSLAQIVKLHIASFALIRSYDVASMFAGMFDIAID
ncbi:hypothetical protein AC579_2867 [Pseudocercospora musae]|uniref:Uncharacterized protein n=1 Tax=Pseudocercospora musae TaxID=113226 RepID=A0A139IU90_9PEZI|nr:hypothetical protein AC579_2867 [Pseudocercospora musae]